jgi:hypothetical protein
MTLGYAAALINKSPRSIAFDTRPPDIDAFGRHHHCRAPLFAHDSVVGLPVVVRAASDDVEFAQQGPHSFRIGVVPGVQARLALRRNPVRTVVNGDGRKCRR